MRSRNFAASGPAHLDLAERRPVEETNTLANDANLTLDRLRPRQLSAW
jgi:hypothetical protein